MTVRKILAQFVAFTCFSFVCNAQNLTVEELVGEYYTGSDLNLAAASAYQSPYSATLALRKDGTYTAGSKCFPVSGRYIYVDGKVTLKAGERGSARCFYSIVVRPEDAGLYENPTAPKDEFLIPVLWSGRVYLLEERGWEDFVASINAGLLPHTERWRNLYLGPFYRRLGDESRPTSGLPDIPAKWKPNLLEKPVEGEIVELRKQGDPDSYTATVNKGRRDGLREGMVLFPRDSQNLLFGKVWVESVTNSDCVVRFWGTAKVGEKLSTRSKIVEQQ